MLMKKKIIMIGVVLLFLTVLPAHAAMARAGGGGTGGGTAGGGGGTGGTHAFPSGGQPSSPLSQFLNYILFGAAASGGAIIFFVRVHAKGAKTRRIMKQLEKIDRSWNYKDYKKTIETIFYKVQNAWMERDQDSARDCLSRSLYNQYRIKSEWMIVRHEKNILKNMRLMEAIPVDAEDFAGDRNDFMWIYIKARAVDYTIDDRTMERKSGSKVGKTFVEYWKLIKEENRWVLDEIKQKDELNLNSL